PQPPSPEFASRAISTEFRLSPWQSGISSCVLFAAKMPAILAVPRTSPFLFRFSTIKRRVFSLEKIMRPRAVAVRDVTGFAETDAMCAAPLGVVCVRLGAEVASDLANLAAGVEREERGAERVKPVAVEWSSRKIVVAKRSAPWME